MIGHLFANGPTYLVIFGAALLVAAGFGYILLSGLHAGVMPLYRNGVVHRDRNPVGFWAAAVLHFVNIVALAALPFFIVWTHRPGN